MEDRFFREPEPVDRDLPENVVSPEGGEREDNELPAGAYIENAAEVFRFEEDTPEEETGEHIKTREVVLPGAQEKKPPVVKVPGAPDKELLTENGGIRGQKKHTKKRRAKIASAVCAAVLLLTGVVLFFRFNDVSITPKGEDASEDAAVFMPETTEEIADFYKKAVKGITKDGKAGYDRKMWQTVSDLNITGIQVADNLISGVFEDYITPAEYASTNTFTKGTDFSKAGFPDFSLKDPSSILSAECEPSGSNYVIKMVFASEDTPVSGESSLEKVTDTVDMWDADIVPFLDGISQLKSYSDIHIVYSDVTIEAEISSDGRLVRVRHTAPADVSIGSARFGLITFRDKHVHFESAAEYSEFTYG